MKLKKKNCIKFAQAYANNYQIKLLNTCPSPFDIKSKKKSSYWVSLSITCTEFENKVVLSLSYKLQRSSMLFHKVRMFSFSKNKKTKQNKKQAVLEPRVSPTFAITYFCNHCYIRFENTSKYVDTLTLFSKNLNQRSLTSR